MHPSRQPNFRPVERLGSTDVLPDLPHALLHGVPGVTYPMRTSELGCSSLLTPLATTDIHSSESWRRLQVEIVVGATADGLRTWLNRTARCCRPRERSAVTAERRPSTVRTAGMSRWCVNRRARGRLGGRRAPRSGAKWVQVRASRRRVCDPLPGRRMCQLAQHDQQPMRRSASPGLTLFSQRAGLPPTTAWQERKTQPAPKAPAADRRTR
jgi:hypothetical protein